MPEVQYRHGQMQRFIAARSFALGQTGVTIRKGQEILFDGTQADFGEGPASYPLLRGAVKTGWVVPADQYDEYDQTAEMPLSANIQVRHPTQGGNPMDQRSQPRMAMATTESDEREVGIGVKAHAKATKDSNTNHRRGQPVNRRPVYASIESQDGVEVRSDLKTLAGQQAMLTTTPLTNLGAALAEAERVTIDPGPGTSREEMMARMSPAQRAEYEAKVSSRRAQYVDEEAPQPVARVASRNNRQTSEGITNQLSAGGGVEALDLSGLGGGAAEEGMTESEGILFKTTNGPKQGVQAHPRQAETARAQPAPRPSVVVKEASADVRRMVAKQLCKDFPDNYDFGASDKKKLARLQADYEDRPDVLRAVFAAEGDAFKALLMEEFPSAFALSSCEVSSCGDLP